MRVMTSTPPTIDRTLARIRAFARFKGWKKSRFAAEAGLPDTTLRNFDKADWSPSPETIRRLEKIIPPDFMAPDEGAQAA